MNALTDYDLLEVRGKKQNALKLLNICADDHVGMVGSFMLLIDRVKQCPKELNIFERPHMLNDHIYPD